MDLGIAIVSFDPREITRPIGTIVNYECLRSDETLVITPADNECSLRACRWLNLIDPICTGT